MPNQDLELSVSEFISLLNQTLEYAYSNVIVVGELTNFRVSKKRWIYFDLKDNQATVKCFGTIYQLPSPMVDGMLVKVRAQPRMHPQYGFSLNIMSVTLSGEGSIKKAANLLKAKLEAEGLFEAERKRQLPYPPASIGLITSTESAAYSDFIKILSTRWGGITINFVDVQVQGEEAIKQIKSAFEQLNALASPLDIIVLTRGGGSAEDLAAFSSEQVTRAVATSRVPTIVAIGHERDVSLAELAADQRASTPSNAAELLVPERKHVFKQLRESRIAIKLFLDQRLKTDQQNLKLRFADLLYGVKFVLENSVRDLKASDKLLEALNPELALARGFTLVRKNGKLIRSVRNLAKNDILDMTFSDGKAKTKVETITEKI